MGSVFSDNDNIISNVKITPSIQDIATTIDYYYHHVWRGNTYKRLRMNVWAGHGTISNTTQETALGKAYIKELRLPFVKKEADALAIAQKLLDKQKYVRITVSFTTTLAALTNDLLDEITITHYNGPTVGTLTIHEMAINMDDATIDIVAINEP